MHKMIFQKTAGSLLLAAGLIAAPLSAIAGSYYTDGVTFTFTNVGNILTLEIDAANHAADPSFTWFDANNIGTIQVKNIGTFSLADVTLQGEGGTSAFTSWTKSDQELNAATSGCTGGSGGIDRICTWANLAASQSRVGPLTDDMVFHFNFSGGNLDFSNPELKVQFYRNDETDKIGSQLSVNIPAVPEPDTYGMFIMGLGILAFLARPRKA